MKSIFKPEGYLSSIIPGYEFREDQLKMAEFIIDMLLEHESGLIEAGTGIGKTLAYIFPALVYAKENNKKISITTETKALQKQIIDKDLPFVKKIFNDFMNGDFSYSICLGSSNYPCRRRYESILKKGRLTKQDENSLVRLNELFETKKIFSRFDIFISSGIWGRINREPDGCNSYRCVFATRCPYQNAKKEWAKSDILIMNHYLFFANIASGRTYLPETNIVIFDEAHSVEDIASAQLGFTAGFNQFNEIVERYYKKKKRNNLLHFIENNDKRTAATELIKRISREGGIFYEKIRDQFISKGNTLRIKEQFSFGNDFIRLLREFNNLMNDVGDNFSNEILKLEFDIAQGRLFTFIENLASFLYQNNDNYVYWIQKDEKELLGDIMLKGQPINISDILNEQVYSHFDSSLFISATLSICSDFSYISKRFGLSNGKSISLSSTFNFKSQVVLYIASDINNPSSLEYIQRSAETSADIIKYLNGNCLILFTSYKMLGEVKKVLSGMISLPIYSQDEYTSGEALELYLGDNNSILMGTHSFWQGIDLPGDLLRGVIMMRLPFSVPDSPIIEARMENFVKEGLNPFISFQVPDAAIKFKQGFGRLIRSRSDKGIVAVMDPRIHTKSYGKYFIRSIPECPTVYTINDMIINYEKIL